MVINFYDTSALLTNNLLPENNIRNYISCTVIAELEQIKNNVFKDEALKASARKISRFLISNPSSYFTYHMDYKKLEKFKKKFSYLPDNNDGTILAEALLLRKMYGYDIKFFTSDVNMFLFAKTLFEEAVFVENAVEAIEPWSGWGKYYPTEHEMTLLYSNPEINTLNANINEYCEIYEGSVLKDILRWDGQKYCKLKYSNFRNSFLNKNIQPLNIQQKMAFDLLQNPSITFKVLTGVAGGGKDYIQILHALDLINKGLFDKIVFIRNLIPFKDAPEIGFLAGSLEEKIAWGLGPIRSILGDEGLEMFEEQGIIQNMNLAFLRGMSFSRTIIYVSEGQNISGGGYKLLVSRCGEGSQLWVNGDFFQADLKKFEKDNGIVRVTNSLKGNPLFGTVKLTETERSKTAELAAII